jgi:carboxylesterase
VNHKKPAGLLILHGFTGSLDTVRSMAEQAQNAGWPYRMPALRGHGTRYEDLVGVRYNDWVTDAEAALLELEKEADQIVIVGLSMGGLTALNLAHRHPEKVAGVVALAPALRFKDPLAALTPLIKLVFTFWDSPNGFQDPSCAAQSTNYKKFPTATFHELLNFAADTEDVLKDIKVPVVGIFARRDTIVHPIVPHLLKTKLKTLKELIFFERSGHELLQDCEALGVAAAAMKAASDLTVPNQEEACGN